MPGEKSLLNFSQRGGTDSFSKEISAITRTARITNELMYSFSGKSRKRRIKGSSPLTKNADSSASNVSIKEKNTEVGDNLPT